VMFGPGGTCALTPSPDVACIAGSTGNRVDTVTCANRARHPVTDANGFESLTYTATKAGAHKASVQAAIAPGSTEYTITISVNGAAPAVTGPTFTNYVGGSPACKLP
jgi:hypothetical protein